MFWSRSASPAKQSKQQDPTLEQAPSARILVVGNPGVGKSSFVHLLANGTVLTNPHWTCGCQLEVVAHVQETQTWVMELWDVGANPKFKKSRRVFYKAIPKALSPVAPVHDSDEPDVDGLILVHDLSNRKSFANLTGWLREVMREVASTNEVLFDHALYFNGGSSSLPVLVVGTKMDLLGTEIAASELAELGIDSIDISTQDPKAFASDTLAFTKISAFFDRVIANCEQQSYNNQRQEDLHDEDGSLPGANNASYGVSSQNPLAPLSRHGPVDSFETRGLRDSGLPYAQQPPRHYTASTRNQRSYETSRPSPASVPSSSASSSPLQQADMSYHLSMPHSRMSQAAYTNILDENDDVA